MYCGYVAGQCRCTGCIRRRGWKRGKEGRRYLCTTCGVLCSSAGYELCIVVLEQVFVEAHVLVFGEYGVVWFEAVLGEHCFIARQSRSMVCQR